MQATNKDIKCGHLREVGSHTTNAVHIIEPFSLSPSPCLLLSAIDPILPPLYVDILYG